MKQLTILIIAGVAAAALVVGVVVFAMPQRSAPQQVQTTQTPQLQIAVPPSTTTEPADPRAQQPGDPGTLTENGQEMQEMNQDPNFIRFKDTADNCINGGIKPGTMVQSPAMCNMAIQQGMSNWCGVGDHYHEAKCEYVNSFVKVYGMTSSTRDLFSQIAPPP